MSCCGSHNHGSERNGNKNDDQGNSKTLSPFPFSINAPNDAKQKALSKRSN